MKRRALIIMLALSLAAIPFLGRAQNDPAGSGADADAEGSASCARIQLGAVVTEGEPAPQPQTPAQGYYTEEGYYYDGYYDEGMPAMPQEGDDIASAGDLIEQELWCDDIPDPGPLNCYEGDDVLQCHFDGVEVYCPQ